MNKIFYIATSRLLIYLFLIIALPSIDTIAEPTDIPFFLYSSDSPNPGQLESWKNISEHIRSEKTKKREDNNTLNLGYSFDLNNPSKTDISRMKPSLWNFNDLQTLKNSHFLKGKDSAYLVYMLLRMLDFKTAKKISKNPNELHEHIDALANTKIPIRNNKGNIDRSLLLKDVFKETGDEIEMTIEPTGTDIGALFLLSSRYYTEKHFMQNSGINKIWGIMEYLSKLFLKKAIFNRIRSHLTDPSEPLTPMDSELALLMGQYVSILEYRNLLLSGSLGKDDKDINFRRFSGFNARMLNNIMANLKGAVLESGEQLFSADNKNNLIKGLANSTKGKASYSDIESKFTQLKTKFFNDIQNSDLLTKNKEDQFLQLLGKEMENQFKQYNLLDLPARNLKLNNMIRELQEQFTVLEASETSYSQATNVLNTKVAKLSTEADKSVHTIALLRKQIEVLTSQHKYSLSISQKLNEECAICLDDFEGTDIGYSNVCSHFLHKTCWEGMQKKYGNYVHCPLCRAQINLNELNIKTFASISQP